MVLYVHSTISQSRINVWQMIGLLKQSMGTHTKLQAKRRALGHWYRGKHYLMNALVANHSTALLEDELFQASNIRYKKPILHHFPSADQAYAKLNRLQLVL